MISEESQNAINKGLAIMFTLNMLMRSGLNKVHKEIDKHDDFEVRLYFRELVNQALMEAKKEGLRIRGA